MIEDMSMWGQVEEKCEKVCGVVRQVRFMMNWIFKAQTTRLDLKSL